MSIYMMYNFFLKQEKYLINLRLTMRNTINILCHTLAYMFKDNYIVDMSTFKKPNYSICIRKHLTILKNKHVKRFTFVE